MGIKRGFNAALQALMAYLMILDNSLIELCLTGAGYSLQSILRLRFCLAGITILYVVIGLPHYCFGGFGSLKM